MSSGIPQLNCRIPAPSNHHIYFWTVVNTSDRGTMGSSKIFLISVRIMHFLLVPEAPTRGMCWIVEGAVQDAAVCWDLRRTELGGTSQRRTDVSPGRPTGCNWEVMGLNFPEEFRWFSLNS